MNKGLAQSSNELSSIVVLRQQQTYQLPSNAGMVRVLSGSAWLTYAGKDIILLSGEEICLPKPYRVIISALGEVPLVFETLWDNTVRFAPEMEATKNPLARVKVVQLIASYLGKRKASIDHMRASDESLKSFS